MNFGFNSTVDTQYITDDTPSVSYLTKSPASVTTKTTVILTTRTGEIQGRFDIPGTKKGPHQIVLCTTGAVFRTMMIDHAPLGTMIEIIRPDKSVFKYQYRG